MGTLDYQRLRGARLPHYQFGCAEVFITFLVKRVGHPTSRHRVLDLRRDRYAAILRAVLQRYDGKLYRLHAWVIMPDHVHLLLNPVVRHGTPVSLSMIVHTIKRVSAARINRRRGDSGSIWQPNYWDSTIRNKTHYRRVRRYIRMNPVKKGLVKSPGEWEWMG